MQNWAPATGTVTSSSRVSLDKIYILSILSLLRMSPANRRMISVDEDTYRQIVRAKGKLEMESGEDLSLGEVVAGAAILVLAGVGLAKILDELSKRR